MAETAKHDAHAGEPKVGPHGGSDDHGADRSADAGHGDHDDHGETELGPIDRTAWAMGALGIFLGLVIAAAFLAAGS